MWQRIWQSLSDRWRTAIVGGTLLATIVFCLYWAGANGKFHQWEPEPRSFTEIWPLYPIFVVIGVILMYFSVRRES